MEPTPSEEQNDLAGAELWRSTENGYGVSYRDEYLGYLHASLGDKFLAYQRRPNELDELLGKFTKEEGVRRILQASGRYGTRNESAR